MQGIINPDETEGMTPEQIGKYNEAERLIIQWREIGNEASRLLYAARTGLEDIDWFDHRHHILNPTVEFVDFWTMSADNVIPNIPIDGTVLDLCCGDGFYDYYFYRHRAKSILAIDINKHAIALAKREHAAPNIKYDIGNVLTCPLSGEYDVIICRGAIEHFTDSNQLILLARIKSVMKLGGWFCGDTTAPITDNPAHKHEFANEEEMRGMLAKVFRHIDTNTLVSRTRTTMFWRCQREQDDESAKLCSCANAAAQEIPCGCGCTRC